VLIQVHATWEISCVADRNSMYFFARARTRVHAEIFQGTIPHLAAVMPRLIWALSRLTTAWLKLGQQAGPVLCENCKF
jgi:hypothetical protein